MPDGKRKNGIIPSQGPGPSLGEMMRSTIIDALNLVPGQLGAAAMGRPALNPSTIDPNAPGGDAARTLVDAVNAGPLALGAALMGRPALTPKPPVGGPQASMTPEAAMSMAPPETLMSMPPAGATPPAAPPGAPAPGGPPPSSAGAGASDPMAQARQRAMMARMGVRGGSIKPPGVNDPDVQAMLQKDVRARTMLAPSMDQVQFTEPDFLARPDGEEMLEKFAFRQMVIMGDNAPKALQQTFNQIQQMKSKRVGARADYFADLIKQRHAMDLQRRNTGDAIDARGLQAAMDRVANIRIQEAALRNQAAALSAKIGAANAPKPLSNRDLKFLNEQTEKVSSAYVLNNQLDSLMSSYRKLGAFRGMGKLSDVMVWGSNLLGLDEDAQNFARKRNAYHVELIKQLAEVAGARAVDANKEADRLRDAFPGPGSPEGDWEEYIRMARAATRKLVKWQIEYADQLQPGLGQQLRRDFSDLSRQQVYHEEMNAVGDESAQMQLDAQARLQARGM